MKLDLAMFSPELQKTSPKTIVNGLSFFVRKNATKKKKKKKKNVYGKIVAKKSDVCMFAEVSYIFSSSFTKIHQKANHNS